MPLVVYRLVPGLFASDHECGGENWSALILHSHTDNLPITMRDDLIEAGMGEHLPEDTGWSRLGRNAQKR
jgi:hypothetical protein